MLFLILYMFRLCDRVDNTLFEGNQEQHFGEEQQQFRKEKQVDFSPCIFHFVPTIAW